MISFKEYLTESRSAPLYHAFKYENLTELDESDWVLFGVTTHDKSNFKRPSGWKPKNTEVMRLGVKGISTTRSKKFAHYFATRWEGSGIIFELDQSKINQRYKVMPINYYHTHNVARSSHEGYNESEEFIITPELDLKKYCTAFYSAGNVDKEDIKWIEEKIKKPYKGKV